ASDRSGRASHAAARRRDACGLGRAGGGVSDGRADGAGDLDGCDRDVACCVPPPQPSRASQGRGKEKKKHLARSFARRASAVVETHSLRRTLMQNVIKPRRNFLAVSGAGVLSAAAVAMLAGRTGPAHAETASMADVNILNVALGLEHE